MHTLSLCNYWLNLLITRCVDFKATINMCIWAHEQKYHKLLSNSPMLNIVPSTKTTVCVRKGAYTGWITDSELLAWEQTYNEFTIEHSMAWHATYQTGAVETDRMDAVLCQIIKYIARGWPVDKRHVSSELMKNGTLLSFKEGLLMWQEWIFIRSIFSNNSSVNVAWQTARNTCN